MMKRTIRWTGCLLHQQACQYLECESDRKQSTFLPDNRRSRPSNMPGDSDEDYKSDDPDASLSHSDGEQDPVGSRMADPIGNRVYSSTSRDKDRPHFATHPSPPLPFPRAKSDPQRPIRPQAKHSMGTSNPSNFGPYSDAFHYSYPNSPVTPQNPYIHMNDAHFPFQSTSNRHYEHSYPNRPPPMPTSGFNSPPSFNRPTFGTSQGIPARHDDGVHQTNISSFNFVGNTIKGSFNDNSVVDTSRKSSCHFLFLDTRTGCIPMYLTA